MPPDPFAAELVALLQEDLPLEKKQAAVADLFRKYGREPPPPITGTITLTEPPDTFR